MVFRILATFIIREKEMSTADELMFEGLVVEKLGSFQVLGEFYYLRNLQENKNHYCF